MNSHKNFEKQLFATNILSCCRIMQKLHDSLIMIICADVVVGFSSSPNVLFVDMYSIPVLKMI